MEQIIKSAPAKKITKAKAKVEKPEAEATEATQAPARSKKELAEVEPRRLHTGATPSSFRVGKSLTPLRHDYRCGQMTQKDHGFLKDCIAFADPKGQFPRLNADAGRVGRLYTQQFVTYEETGVYDEDQIITLTDKAREYTKPVKAA
jgi:hypothetical protein